jgi:hypothetical protein
MESDTWLTQLFEFVSAKILIWLFVYVNMCQIANMDTEMDLSELVFHYFSLSGSTSVFEIFVDI